MLRKRRNAGSMQRRGRHRSVRSWSSTRQRRHDIRSRRGERRRLVWNLNASLQKSDAVHKCAPKLHEGEWWSRCPLAW